MGNTLTVTKWFKREKNQRNAIMLTTKNIKL